MTSGNPLGEFEQVVVLAILRLADSAYGVSIRSEIATCTRRNVSPGALYTTLNRLQEKGVVTSVEGPPTPERGGRAKRFYSVTPRGRKQIVESQKAFQRLLAGLDIAEVTRG